MMGAAVVGLASMLAVTGCGSASDSDSTEVSSNVSFPEGTTMQRIADEGHITIGVHFDQFPLAGKNLAGEMEGFDPTVARYLAAGLGIDSEKINWVEAIATNREPFIAQGKVDLIVSSYSITPEREEVVSFAGPFYVDHQALLVKKGNPLGITGPDDLDGRTVCAPNGSTLQQRILSDYPKAKVVAFDTNAKCAAALKSGQVDSATANEGILLSQMAREPGEFEIAGEPFSDENYGIGIKKGDVEFCEYINDRLAKMQSSGEYAEAVDDTLGKAFKTAGAPAPEASLPPAVKCR